MKTYYAKPGEVEREWLLIDGEDQVLGRVAAKAAHILRGKHKPQYTPHVDTGDFVIIVNADKIRVTGNKAKDKKYYRHSGFPGGLKSESFEEAMAKHRRPILFKDNGTQRAENTWVMTTMGIFLPSIVNTIEGLKNTSTKGNSFTFNPSEARSLLYQKSDPTKYNVFSLQWESQDLAVMPLSTFKNFIEEDF